MSPTPCGPQLDAFSQDGEQRKRIGIKQVEDHNPSFCDTITGIIAALVMVKATITSDDVRNAAAIAGVERPNHPNAWGAAMTSAARKGFIEKTGEYTKSKTKTRNSGLIAVWRKP